MNTSTLHILFHSLILSLGLFVSACTKSGPSVASSGDKEFDKTASFVLYAAQDLRKRPKFTTPEELVGYMTSALGLGEIIPPSEEFEKDAADDYSGPRPSSKISFYGKRFTDWETPGQIVVEGDDEARTIIAYAYRGEEEEPFFTWTWDFDNLG